MTRTRELLGTVREAWRRLGPVAKVGVVAFELAWLVQVGILVRLFLG